MTLKYEHTILLVDDEASILKALKRLFRREGYQIYTAEGGDEALVLLERHQNSVSLIISDQRMPGMNGASFLEKSIPLCPDAIRFLLTGYSDMDAVVEAINKGNIHRYLTKPWDDEEIASSVREALKIVELKMENLRLTELTQHQNEELNDLNKKLEETVEERTWALKYQNKILKGLNHSLENSLMESIRLLLSLVESSNPQLGGYMNAVGVLARKIAINAGMDQNEQNRLEMAGLVHDIGLLGMPESILNKDERFMSADEFDAYKHHPEIAALSLSSVEGLKPISEIVNNHHENMDGSGFPNALSGDEISIDTRILSVAADYCTILHLWPKRVKRFLHVARKYMKTDTLASVELGDASKVKRDVAEKIIMEGVGKRYDDTIVRHFLRTIGSDAHTKVLKKLPFNLLRKGMILDEDLRLKDGRLLLTRGTELVDETLTSIQGIGCRGMIEGGIAVSVRSAAARKAGGRWPPKTGQCDKL